MSKRLDKAIEVAKSTMQGDLRDVCLDIFKSPKIKGKPWKDMTEDEQRYVVSTIEQKIGQSIRRSIDIIASEGRRNIRVTLKQMTVKDGLKGTFECAKTHELRHELLDAQGDTVLIVLTNSDKYLGEKAGVKYDKDQPELIPTDEKENDDAEENYDPKTGEVETDEGDDDDSEADEDFDDEDDED